MQPSFYAVLDALLLVVALSLDAFVACFAYGTKQIKVSRASLFVINAVCTSMLGLSLFVGASVRPWLSPRIASGVCAGILTAMGMIKLFDWYIKAMIRRHASLSKSIRFSAFSLRFILSVYADPEAADQDLSRVLSPGEAASLAVALSLDGLAAGFGAGLLPVSFLLVLLMSFLSGAAAVLSGCWIGNRVAKAASLDLSWLSGALLILLALLKA